MAYVVQGTYESTPPTLGNLEDHPLQLDALGNLKTTLGTAITGLVAGVETDTILNAPYARSDHFSASINSDDASAGVVVKAKTASKKIYVTSLLVSVGAAINVIIEDEDGNDLVKNVYLAANGGYSLGSGSGVLFSVPTNKDLKVLTSGAGNVSVFVSGYVI